MAKEEDSKGAREKQLITGTPQGSQLISSEMLQTRREDGFKVPKGI